MTTALPGLDILDRMVQAVELVKDRMLRASAALEKAGIEYAVIGGNAVAAWVAKVDRAAVRNTQDVDILLRRADLARAKVAMEAAGFVYRHAAGIDMFLDGPKAKARDAVHVIFAGEKVRNDDPVPTPDVSDVQNEPPFRIVSLGGLLRLKLIANRDKDRTHIRDLIGVGLVDETWVEKVPRELAPRLQQILDTPEG
jgi:hypothetical protein